MYPGNSRHQKLHFPTLRTWQLVLIFVLLAMVSATLLRLNNLGMDTRRTAVIQADKQGDPAKTQAALADLQRYVSSHMNTDMDKGVYLESAYRRDYEAAVAAAATSQNPNNAVYQRATTECQQANYSAYVQCVTARIGSIPQGNEAEVKLPKPEAYKHDYASPVWSADLAGIFVGLTLLIGLTIVARLVLLGLAHLLIRGRRGQISS